MDFYCCTPILYISKLKHSIDNDQKGILAVFAAYKRWFALCKDTGKSIPTSRLMIGKFVWYGGKKGIKVSTNIAKGLISSASHKRAKKRAGPITKPALE